MAKPLLNGLGLTLLFMARKVLWNGLKAAGKLAGKGLGKVPLFKRAGNAVGKAFNRVKNFFGKGTKVLDENKFIQNELAKVPAALSARHEYSTIGGVALSAKQNEDLFNDRTIFIEGMQKKDGTSMSSYVKLDKDGNPTFSLHNPDIPPELREMRVPNSIGGVLLSQNEKDALRTENSIFLENMHNKKGEAFSAFVKIDPETQKVCFSQNGFNTNPIYNVPQEIKGVALNELQKTQLQEGKPVYIADMNNNGKQFSVFVKMNQKQGKLEFYAENPDKPRQNFSMSENRQNETQTQKSANRKKVA
jgi:hypothetical protein